MGWITERTRLSQMKITEVQTVTVDAERGRTWLFVELYSDEGIVGVGEASQSNPDRAVVAQIEALAPLYVGRNPLDLVEKRNALLQQRPGGGRTLWAAVSGLEQALWDLCGKALGVPSYQLFGGSVRDRIRAYANIALAAGDSGPEQHAELAAKAVAEAYGVEIAPHNRSGPVATAASLHLCATLPNFLILEYCWGMVPWRADLVGGSERVEAGHFPLPSEPGLGFGWDGAVARRHPARG